VTFNALGGLANRLRAIFSRYEPGIRVVWTRTWDIANAHFLEVFEPVPGIEFVDGGASEESWHAAVNYNDWHRHYALLRPTAALRDRISGLQEAMGEYDAIHVRRTDHVKLAHMQGKYTTDEEFIAWIVERDSDASVFLATCNAETRQIFKRALGPSLFWQGDMQPSTATQHESRRYNSLADSVVDLFLCAGARSFMGSAHSSFSELVTHLRELR
jgi:GDP-fucose protein O-fucosyltransferase